MDAFKLLMEILHVSVQIGGEGLNGMANSPHVVNYRKRVPFPLRISGITIVKEEKVA